MNFNEDDNLMGRILALALIVGVAAGVRAIDRGGFSCPFCAACSFMIGAPAPTPAASAEPGQSDADAAVAAAADAAAKPAAPAPAQK